MIKIINKDNNLIDEGVLKMSIHKFDVKKLEKLNNPERLNMLDLNKIITELDLPTKSTLVDIGAGTGIFSEKLLNLIPDSSCYAFDISEEMIEWMKLNRINNLESRLNVGLMDENKIPLKDDKADLAFMITLHHELENGGELLKDVNRILKDSGKVLICDWKEGKHHHFVKKECIINDLKHANFKDIKEIESSEKLVCIIASKQ
ncbi:Methyltransferase domain [Romboutsia lituseburensis]|uniref:Methyltransferase domain-containing protein n=2 Tax=Romboutsia lituseburensis TaxID=1537 RepID=A0A1G9MUY9_9FIRM|nr:Methyltransferase domain [Romboutsia lituseburensis]SDL77933.1 Methyltransferase domain-containing protein [Romboutsia lituseburensis DSM 797]